MKRSMSSRWSSETSISEKRRRSVSGEMLLFCTWVHWTTCGQVKQASWWSLLSALCSKCLYHVNTCKKSVLPSVVRRTSLTAGHHNVSSETWLFSLAVNIVVWLLTWYTVSCRMDGVCDDSRCFELAPGFYFLVQVLLKNNRSVI